MLDMTNPGSCFLLLSLCGQSVAFYDQNLRSLLSGSVELSNLHGISGEKESMPFSAQAMARVEAQEHQESRRAHRAWNQSVLTDPPSLCLGSPVVSPHGNVFRADSARREFLELVGRGEKGGDIP